MDDLELCQATGPTISAADLHAAISLRSEVFVMRLPSP